MKKEQVIQQVIAILKEFKNDLGVEDLEVTPTTIPIGGIPGFDSLLGVIATTHISVAFDIPDDKGVDNLFGNTKKSGEVVYFNVNQIAEKILKMKKDSE